MRFCGGRHRAADAQPGGDGTSGPDAASDFRAPTGPHACAPPGRDSKAEEDAGDVRRLERHLAQLERKLDLLLAARGHPEG